MFTNINVGVYPNDHTGDTLRNAMIIVNDNFEEISTFLETDDILTISQIIDLQGNLDTINTTLNQLPQIQDDIDNINTSIYNINQSLINQNYTITGLSASVSSLQSDILTKIGEAPIDGITYGRKDADWVAISAITGATGPQGATGATGVNGINGATGPEGPKGATGNNGINGATGANGPQGPIGPIGATGATGSTLIDRRVGNYVMATDLFTSPPASGGDFNFTGVLSGTIRGALSTAAHPGVMTVRNNSVAFGGCIITTLAASAAVTTQSLMFVGAGWKYEAVIHPMFNNPTPGFTATVKCGFYDGPSGAATDPVNGVYIEMTGTASGMSFVGRTSVASVRSQTPTSYSLAYGTTATSNYVNWHRLVVTCTSASLITYEIYNNSNTLVWTDYLTSTIPTTGLLGVFLAGSTNTTLYDIIQIDLLQITVPTLNR